MADRAIYQLAQYQMVLTEGSGGAQWALFYAEATPKPNLMLANGWFDGQTVAELRAIADAMEAANG